MHRWKRDTNLLSTNSSTICPLFLQLPDQLLNPLRKTEVRASKIKMELRQHMPSNTDKCKTLPIIWLFSSINITKATSRFRSLTHKWANKRMQVRIRIKIQMWILNSCWTPKKKLAAKFQIKKAWWLNLTMRKVLITSTHHKCSWCRGNSSSWLNNQMALFKWKALMIVIFLQRRPRTWSQTRKCMPLRMLGREDLEQLSPIPTLHTTTSL